jgi:hypothetical protein
VRGLRYSIAVTMWHAVMSAIVLLCFSSACQLYCSLDFEQLWPDIATTALHLLFIFRLPHSSGLEQQH